MSERGAFERILSSLYDAMLDDTRWPATSALIDEACGITGNALMVGEGPKDDLRILFVVLYYRGQRREDLEREYLEVYHPTDERVPRFRRLPDSRLVHITDLYTAEELKTSPTSFGSVMAGKCLPLTAAARRASPTVDPARPVRWRSSAPLSRTAGAERSRSKPILAKGR